MTDSSTSAPIRPATADDALDVRRILDAAMLEFAALEERIDADDVLVASEGEPRRALGTGERGAQPPVSREADRREASDRANGECQPPVSRERAGRIRGAIVLEPNVSAVVTEGIASTVGDDHRGAHVDAIAVRRRHRGRGIGSALVERALDREGRLTAHFDDGVRPFYEALGFEILSMGDDRYAGVRRA